MLKTIELPSVALLPIAFATETPEDDLAGSLRSLLEQPDLDAALEAELGLEERLLGTARSLARKAYPRGRTTDRQSASWIDHGARDALHRALLVLYQQHVRLPVDASMANQFHPFACTLMRILERPWEEDMLRRVRLAHDLSESALPSVPDEFAAWFRDTAFAHPLYEHDLYAFLASDATRSQLEWFFRMECAGEAAFDDLVAIACLRLVTFLPLPLFKVPFFLRRIADSTRLLAALPYFLAPDFFRAAMTNYLLWKVVSTSLTAVRQ